MATYRAYFLDSENHITERREIEAESGEEAVQTARQWIDGKAIEVWCGPIFVERLQPQDSAIKRFGAGTIRSLLS